MVNFARESGVRLFEGLIFMVYSILIHVDLPNLKIVFLANP